MIAQRSKDICFCVERHRRYYQSQLLIKFLRKSFDSRAVPYFGCKYWVTGSPLEILAIDLYEDERIRETKTRTLKGRALDSSTTIINNELNKYMLIYFHVDLFL